MARQPKGGEQVTAIRLPSGAEIHVVVDECCWHGAEPFAWSKKADCALCSPKPPPLRVGHIPPRSTPGAGRYDLPPDTGTPPHDEGAK